MPTLFPPQMARQGALDVILVLLESIIQIRREAAAVPPLIRLARVRPRT